jgi:uncharacterized membrane protein
MPIHLFVSHFPVALVIAGALVDLVGTAAGDSSMRRGAGHLLIAGALAAFASFFTGGAALSAYLMQNPAPTAAVESHTQWGGAGVWLVCGAGAVRLLWARRLDGPYGWASLGVAVGAATVVVAITLSGTAIRHG